MKWLLLVVLGGALLLPARAQSTASVAAAWLDSRRAEVVWETGGAFGCLYAARPGWPSALLDCGTGGTLTVGPGGDAASAPQTTGGTRYAVIVLGEIVAETILEAPERRWLPLVAAE